jgi:phage shock protein A
MSTRRLLERLTVLLKANLSELLLEAPDVPDAIAHYLGELDRHLGQAKDAVASVVAQIGQLERRRQEAAAQSAAWDARTDAALLAGDDEEARRALQRKESYDRLVEDLERRLERLQRLQAEMRTSLTALQMKSEDVRRRRDAVEARHARQAAQAEAQRTAAQSAAGTAQAAAKTADVRAELLAAAHEVDQADYDARIERARQRLAAPPEAAAPDKEQGHDAHNA